MIEIGVEQGHLAPACLAMTPWDGVPDSLYGMENNDPLNLSRGLFFSEILCWKSNKTTSL